MFYIWCSYSFRLEYSFILPVPELVLAAFLLAQVQGSQEMLQQQQEVMIASRKPGLRFRLNLLIRFLPALLDVDSSDMFSAMAGSDFLYAMLL